MGARRRHELGLPLSNSSTVGGHVLPQARHLHQSEAVADGSVHRGSVWKGPSDHTITVLYVPVLGGHRRATCAAWAGAQRGILRLKTGAARATRGSKTQD